MDELKKLSKSARRVWLASDEDRELSMSLMERLLKTLRYNFLTEALDFVGVHQERTLQVRGCQHLWGQDLGFKGVWAPQN